MSELSTDTWQTIMIALLLVNQVLDHLGRSR